METRVDEDGLGGLSLGDFDRVTLLGRAGGGSHDIWHRVHVVRDVVHEAAPPPLDDRTLFVHVDDETDEATAERVRIALGLPPDQLYAA